MEAASPWTPAGEPAPIGHATTTVMVVDGQAFYLSDARGDVVAGATHGLFVGDTRFLSEAELLVNGQPLELLAMYQPDAFAATIVLRPRTQRGFPSQDVLLVRRRYLGLGFREDVEVRNYGSSALQATVTLKVSADFADLFAVKEGRAGNHGSQGRLVSQRLRLESVDGDVRRATELTFHGPPANLAAGGATWRFEAAAHSVTVLCWDATVSFNGDFLSRHTTCGELPDRMEAVLRAKDWDQDLPVLSTPGEKLRDALTASVDDLGALRLFDPTAPRRPVIAAGAPWFMTLFGRDSLLSAWMALPLGIDLPLGVLDALALLQGTQVDAQSEEEPGRILHELRFTRASTLSLLGGTPYFGSIDSTPLFVLLLAEAARWGAPLESVDALLPAADAALHWLETFGDPDGDGFVEYLRRTPTGLANQGWKDSWDGIRYRDGTVASAPLALCEVQAYAFGAYRARADLARWLGGSAATIEHWEERASALRRAFNDRFWMDDVGTFAVALDADKRQVGSITSNPGHCLWTGIVDEELAPAVGATLMSSGLWSGWGIRTLSAENAAYNPMSYHCGSVWPHDTAIGVAGLTRYGLFAEAGHIAQGLLDAAAADGGALPELFCGVERSDVGVPVAYPTSCQPQAWAAAAPLLILRSLLGLEPSAPDRRLRLTARGLPPAWRPLSWNGIHLGDHRIGVTVDADVDAIVVRGLPAGWTLDDIA